MKGNTAGSNTEIKVFYSFDSKNNSLEREQYTVTEQGTGGVFIVKSV